MTPEEVKHIYESLEKLIIELDPDPTSRGYKYLQDLISRTRGYLNETSHHLTKVLRARHTTEIELQVEESVFEVKADELLAHDRRVTLLPNIDDRKSMINVLLSDDKRKIQQLKLKLKNLGHVEKVVRHRHKELENSMSAIRLQRSLVETESRTGSFYGDEDSTSRGTRGVSHDFDDSEIQKMFDEAEAEFVEAAQEAPAAQEASAPGSDDFEELLTGISDEPEPVKPQVVVVREAPAPNPSMGGEDPDIAKFLDGDVDFEGMFDSV